MDDRFLHEQRRDPDPAFAARLRSELRRPEHAPRSALRLRPLPALAALVASAAVVALFVFPSVRVSAQGLLDLFRVRNFAAVSFDPARLEKLRSLHAGEDLPILGKHEVLSDPGEPKVMPTAEAATSVAGLQVRTPSDLPNGLKLTKILVQSKGAMRLTADGAALQSLLESLDIRDLRVPAGLDGKTVTVRKPPIVFEEFKSEKHEAMLLQALAPEIELPVGVDLSQLAEIGMRIMGLESGEARRLAHSVDWHTTLLVPVPQNASKFRTVEVSGNRGLMISTTGDPSAAGKEAQRSGTVVLWSERERVFAVVTDLGEVPALEIAQSVR